MNKVLLIGHVGKTPEIRYLETPDHPKVAQFTLATTEARKAKDGTVTKLTEWHNIVAWRGLAELAEKYIRKGSQIYVEGQIRTRSWTDQAGAKQYRTEIIANAIQLLGRKSDNPGAQPGAFPPPQPQGYQQAQPGMAYQQPQQPAYQAQSPAGFQPAAQPAAPEYPAAGDPGDDLPF